MSQNLLNSLNSLRSRDSMAYYLGNLASFPRLMIGRLLLNSKYLAYHICDIHPGGVFQPARLTATGRVLAIPIEKIIDVSVEGGVRSKRTRPNWKDKRDFDRKASGERQLNIPPRPLDSSEHYQEIMVTTETENGVEVAIFEVDNPTGWEQALKAHLARIRT
ncbi:MAG: hypothetical protein HYU03_03130 [Thaumarchaeota archaeon]|nr:hypothetical protein [Nitrososphaerota archaeon]